MTETTAASTRVPVSIQLIGGLTVLLEIGGLRLLTDPAFDAPGLVPSGDRILTKTTGPAVAAEEIGPIDAVLLSHDQYGDNLDRSGRALLAHADVVLTTPEAPTGWGAASPATTGCGLSPPESASRSDPAH
jgi:L-ascorbate metabolism protein UlaG (beta-lactamase superfamily)